MAGAWEGEPSLEGVVTSKSRRHRSEGRWLGRLKSRGVQFRQSRWFSELRLWLALGKASRRWRESLRPNPAGTDRKGDGWVGESREGFNSAKVVGFLNCGCGWRLGRRAVAGGSRYLQIQQAQAFERIFQRGFLCKRGTKG